MRAPEKRVFKIDVGNIPPREVEQFMQKIINKMKKTPVIDQKTGEYNLKYNVESVTEDYFMPVRGGDSGTEIDTLPGLSNNDQIDDIEYLKNKLMASLRIPKAFLGYEEGLSGGKATLAAEDVRFARTIERIQRIVISELTKVAVAHLYSQGYTDAALVDFELELTNPSTIYEQERLELWNTKIGLARDMKAESLVSEDWMYDNIFNFSDDEVAKMRDEIIEDKKQEFRKESIANEGHDPAQPAQEGQMKSEPGMSNEDDETVDDDKGGRDHEDRDTYGVRDVLGKYDYTHSAKRDDNPTKHNYRVSPLALSHLDKLKNHYGKKEVKMLNEIESIEDDLNKTNE